MKTFWLLRKKNCFLCCWCFRINWCNSRVLTWLQSYEETQMTFLFPLLHLDTVKWSSTGWQLHFFQVDQLFRPSFTAGMPLLLTLLVAVAELTLPSSRPKFKPRLTSHTVKKLFPPYWKQTCIWVRKAFPELEQATVLLSTQQPNTEQKQVKIIVSGLKTPVLQTLNSHNYRF